MASTVVIGALTERVACIRREIIVLEAQAAAQRSALTHIEATIRLFDPSYDGRQGRPKRAAYSPSAYFAKGEITRRCRDALREAEAPISAEDVAIRAMQDKGLDTSDRAVRSGFIRQVLWALRRLAKAGRALRHGDGLGARWALAEG